VSRLRQSPSRQLVLIKQATAQPVPPLPPEVAAKLRQKELSRIRDARLRCDEMLLKVLVQTNFVATLSLDKGQR
jgi:hypothetical protein